MWSCRGTLRLVTSAPRPRFAFGKASAAVTLVGRLKCLDYVPPHNLLSPPSWSSSLCSVTATSTPLLPPPKLAPYCLPPAVDLSVDIQKGASVTPVLLAVANAVLAHPPGTPHQSLRHSYPILPSGTASFPGTAPAFRSTLSLPSAG